AQRLTDTRTIVESRQDVIDGLQRRMSELAALGAKLDERRGQLQTRIEGAEQRFVGLSASSEEAERLGKTLTVVASNLTDAEHQTQDLGNAIAAISGRCQSVEELAAATEALRPELE